MFLTLILLSFQYFFSRKADFYFHKFLFNFFKYSSLKFPPSYLYNIFTIYFSGNSSLLKSLFSIISNFFYLLISTLSLLLNSTITFFVFSKSSSLFYILCFAVNLLWLPWSIPHIIQVFALWRIYAEIFFTSNSYLTASCIILMYY